MIPYLIDLAVAILIMALHVHFERQSRRARHKLAEFDAVCLKHWDRLCALRNDPAAFDEELRRFEAWLEKQKTN